MASLTEQNLARKEWLQQAPVSTGSIVVRRSVIVEKGFYCLNGLLSLRRSVIFENVRICPEGREGL